MASASLKAVKPVTSYFTIIKNAPPVPEKIRSRGRPSLYPFAQMAVGDAFDAPRDLGRILNSRGEMTSDKRQTSVSSSACSYARKHGGKFTVRLIDENTVRCWRIA